MIENNVIYYNLYDYFISYLIHLALLHVYLSNIDI